MLINITIVPLSKEHGVDLSYRGPERFEVIAWLIKEYKLLQTNIFVEIGVRHAETAEHLLRLYTELITVLVDPYLPYNDVTHIYTEEEQNAIKAAAHFRLFDLESRVSWVEESNPASAVEAYECIFTNDEQDTILPDIVFIDGDHSYEAAKEDIDKCIVMVRPGGLIMGHDYSMHEVKRAVDEVIIGKYGKTVFHSDIHTDCWWAQI